VTTCPHPVCSYQHHAGQVIERLQYWHQELLGGVGSFLERARKDGVMLQYWHLQSGVMESFMKMRKNGHGVMLASLMGDFKVGVNTGV
jgi:hypothetical protein